MNHEKYAKDVNDAFKQSTKILDGLKNDLHRETLELNLSVLFGQCAIELVKAGYSKEKIRQRLEIEFSIYDGKQELRRT